MKRPRSEKEEMKDTSLAKQLQRVPLVVFKRQKPITNPLPEKLKLEFFVQLFTSDVVDSEAISRFDPRLVREIQDFDECKWHVCRCGAVLPIACSCPCAIYQPTPQEVEQVKNEFSMVYADPREEQQRQARQQNYEIMMFRLGNRTKYHTIFGSYGQFSRDGIIALNTMLLSEASEHQPPVPSNLCPGLLRRNVQHAAACHILQKVLSEIIQARDCYLELDHYCSIIWYYSAQCLTHKF